MMLFLIAQLEREEIVVPFCMCLNLQMVYYLVVESDLFSFI